MTHRIVTTLSHNGTFQRWFVGGGVGRTQT